RSLNGTARLNFFAVDGFIEFAYYIGAVEQGSILDTGSAGLAFWPAEVTPSAPAVMASSNAFIRLHPSTASQPYVGRQMPKTIRCEQVAGCSHRIIKLISNNQTTTLGPVPIT